MAKFREPTDRRSWWGWGVESSALSDDECRAYGNLMPGLAEDPVPVPRIRDLGVREPRISAPDSLAEISSTSAEDRVAHTYGKAYRDVVRSLAGDVANPPDLVVHPRSEVDVVDVLDWADEEDVIVVPYGGGSSVVGGVECRESDRPFVSMDMTHMDRVLEIDRTSLAARIQGGVLGPVLEDQLRPHGLTMRHFPQSFEFSTLGGWLVTRSGGHYATARTHIDEFVESIRTVTPAGVMESWRLPGSGAGPSPDRLVLGSEGILGVVTEAWMRIQRRPEHKASASVTFQYRNDAFAAVREIVQAGYTPANCRLLDPGEAALSGAGAGTWVLVLGVESPHHPVADELDALVEIAHDNGGRTAEGSKNASADASNGSRTSSSSSDHASADASRDGGDAPAEAWRSAFLRMPYVRDAMARMGAITETFETATTWDRIDDLYTQVNTRIGAVVEEVTGAPGLINCRFTHVYPDGAAPYFTVIAAGRRGSELAMWDEIKDASMDVLADLGATVSHHHAVGRDHRRGYDRQRPDLFAEMLSAAKDVVDPSGILNPGVLIDP